VSTRSDMAPWPASLKFINLFVYTTTRLEFATLAYMSSIIVRSADGYRGAASGHVPPCRPMCVVHVPLTVHVE